MTSLAKDCISTMELKMIGITLRQKDNSVSYNYREIIANIPVAITKRKWSWAGAIMQSVHTLQVIY